MDISGYNREPFGNWRVLSIRWWVLMLSKRCLKVLFKKMKCKTDSRRLGLESQSCGLSIHHFSEEKSITFRGLVKSTACFALAKSSGADWMVRISKGVKSSGVDLSHIHFAN